MNLVLIEGDELVIRAPGCQPYRIEVSRLKTERDYYIGTFDTVEDAERAYLEFRP